MRDAQCAWQQAHFFLPVTYGLVGGIYGSEKDAQWPLRAPKVQIAPRLPVCVVIRDRARKFDDTFNIYAILFIILIKNITRTQQTINCFILMRLNAFSASIFAREQRPTSIAHST